MTKSYNLERSPESSEQESGKGRVSGSAREQAKCSAKMLCMASVLQIADPDAVRRIRRVQAITVSWMSVEATVSLFAAWQARSPALLAFGGDSTVELLSVTVVLWRFRTDAAQERRAARLQEHCCSCSPRISSPLRS